jgi:hypothetical protein
MRAFLFLALLLGAATLTGCPFEPTVASNQPHPIVGMDGCTAQIVNFNTMHSGYVVRCNGRPTVSTTYPEGKHSATSITVEPAR